MESCVRYSILNSFRSRLNQSEPLFASPTPVSSQTPLPCLKALPEKKNISGSGVIDEKQDWEIQESSQATRSGKVATGSKPTEPISGLVMNRQFPTRPAVVVKAVAVDIQLK